MRFGVDTGGTFTDLIVEDDQGDLHMFKAPTTPQDPIRGVIDALKVAAGVFKTTLPELLGQSENFIYGTTHAINAIITGNVARTAFVTTAGHPDVLTLREGGRSEPFNFTVPYPEPYVPRSLTFEAAGRILVDGSVATPFDDSAIIATIEAMKRKGVEAVAVCLLWSIVNPEHELRVGELIEKHMPGVP
jgi:N-methylhydantoinase A